MSRHRIGRPLAAVLAASVAGLGLAGCGAEPAIRTVALVVGQHAGSAALLDAEGKAITPVSAAMDPVLRGRGTVTVIVNDGRPRSVRTIELKYTGNTSTKREDSYHANKKAFEAALSRAVPEVGQADPAAALKLAGDAVREKANPEVIAFDNGLSTTGAMLMQLGLVDVGTDVAGLARQSKGLLLGTFEKIPVRWFGLCSVVQPQPACSAGVQEQLKTYYRTLIEDAGGKVIFDETPLGGGTPASGVPAVDIVRWRQQRPTPRPTASPTVPPRPPLLKILTEDLVRFEPNSDAYADVPAAGRAIAELAPTLSKDAYAVIYVVGCTADDPASTEAQMKRRSVSRATTIAADLARHGATSRLVPGGLAWRCPGFRVHDDAANRRVIVSSEPVR
jgi:hypothetical protein